MANPNYPQAPMGGHPGHNPMGHPSQPQMQPPPRANVVRRGTSRAVPVVVSAGLAIGVFCGLLFGIGVPEKATAAPSTGNNVKAPDPSETTPTAVVTPPPKKDPTPTASSTTPTVAAGTGSGSATPAVAGTGSGSAATAAGTGSGSAATPTIAKAEPAAVKAKLTVELKPETIASTAKITVDGVDVTNGAFELDLGTAKKKEVKVVVKASGYKDVEQKVEIEGDTTVKIELVKRATGGGGGLRRPPPPGGSGKKKPPGGGGLIDI